MDALTHGNVRVSLGRDTEDSDVRRLAEVLPDLVEQLRTETGVPR
jgi:cysteine desulfurase